MGARSYILRAPMVTPPSAVQLDPEALLARVRQLESQLKLSEARCARAEYKLQDLLRRIYGPKSEKISPAQWVLFGLPEAAEVALARATSKTTGTTGTKSKKRGGRRAAPQDLPVHREVIDLPEEQKAGLVKIREEITEQIEYRPSLFFRRQIIRRDGEICPLPSCIVERNELKVAAPFLCFGAVKCIA